MPPLWQAPTPSLGLKDGGHLPRVGPSQSPNCQHSGGSRTPWLPLRADCSHLAWPLKNLLCSLLAHWLCSVMMNSLPLCAAQPSLDRPPCNIPAGPGQVDTPVPKQPFRSGSSLHDAQAVLPAPGSPPSPSLNIARSRFSQVVAHTTQSLPFHHLCAVDAGIAAHREGCASLQGWGSGAGLTVAGKPFSWQFSSIAESRDLSIFFSFDSVAGLPVSFDSSPVGWIIPATAFARFLHHAGCHGNLKDYGVGLQRTISWSWTFL